MLSWRENIERMETDQIASVGFYQWCIPKTTVWNKLIIDKFIRRVSFLRRDRIIVEFLLESDTLFYFRKALITFPSYHLNITSPTKKKHLFMFLFLIICSYKKHIYIHTHTHMFIYTHIDLYKHPFFCVEPRVEEYGIAVLQNTFARKDRRNHTASRKIHCLASYSRIKMVAILWRLSLFLIEQTSHNIAPKLFLFHHFNYLFTLMDIA